MSVKMCILINIGYECSETIKNDVSLEKNDYLCVIIFEICDERSEI